MYRVTRDDGQESGQLQAGVEGLGIPLDNNGELDGKAIGNDVETGSRIGTSGSTVN